MRVEDLDRTKQIVKSIDIPPQPRIVLEIYKIFQQPDHDVRKIIKLVGDDVTLSARLIKLANSPLLGAGRKIGSIRDAFMILGTKNFYNCVLAASLRDALSIESADKTAFESFWDHCHQIARAAELIVVNSSALSSILPVHLVYMAGLFHDCGIPLMMKRFPAYTALLRDALNNEPSIIEMEESRFGTNHAMIGFFMAKSWHLPMPVCQAISIHHHEEPDASFESIPRKLWAILILAEYCAQCGRNGDEEVQELYDDDWQEWHATVLNELYLTPHQMMALRQIVCSVLAGDLKNQTSVKGESS